MYPHVSIDLAGTPALTLRSPWAHTVTWGGKNIENRTWPPTRGVGMVLIHAGCGWDRSADVTVTAGGPGGPRTAAVVSLVAVDGVCDLSRHSDRLLCRCGTWAQPGHLHWKIRLLARIVDPVGCPGRLRLWQPTDAVRAAVADRLVLVA